MKQTPNYNLNKLESADTADLTQFNPNWDTIDAKLNEHTAHFNETATQAHLGKNIAIEDTGGHFVSSEVEGALSELFTSVSNGKTQLETAVTDKDGTVSKAGSIATFNELDDGIRSIPQAKGNAVTGDVLSGKTFSSETAGIEVVGTMPNQGQKIYTPGTANITIPAGYHDGTGRVNGDADLISANIKAGKNIFGVAGNSNVVDTSPGTAAAADILSGKIAFVDGAQRTGTMTNRGAYNITPGASNIAIPAGYHSGSGVVYGDADLVAGNIKSGVNIFGVAGSLVPTSNKVLYVFGDSIINFVQGYTYASYVTYQVNSSSLYIKSERESDITIVSDIAVNLTGVSMVYIIYSTDGGYATNYLVASTSKTGDYSTYNSRATLQDNSDSMLVGYIDVSGLSGNYYIRVHVHGTRPSTGLAGSLYLYGMFFNN